MKFLITAKPTPASPIKLIFLNVFNRSKDPHNF